MSSKLEKIEDIQNILYINLEDRTDRKEHIENQMKKLNFNAQRFNAIKDINNPAIGCSRSHIGCLELALQNNWNHVLVMEDDIEFLNPKLFLTQLNKFLQRHTTWDVLIIAGNNIGDYEIIDETCVKISKCYCATGYLVNEHYIKKLLDNFYQSIINWIQVDVYWCDLQKIDYWLMLTPLTIIQKPDYSDIEKKSVDYTNQMLKLTCS
jgi:glycosyl transferase family 25